MFFADGTHIYSRGAPHPTLIPYNLDDAELLSFLYLIFSGGKLAPPLEWDFFFFFFKGWLCDPIQNNVISILGLFVGNIFQKIVVFKSLGPLYINKACLKISQHRRER